MLAAVPDDECSVIVEENARRMLNFPRVSARDRQLAEV
ncbi:amidohydrolase 2 [Mycobacterium paraintracellulare]|nr:amidohydrolase 2 [Mycobacterium paraintracellulare]